MARWELVSAALIFVDLLALFGFLLNIRGEYRLAAFNRYQQSQSPAKALPLLKVFINRLCVLGLCIHIAWCVDPASYLGIYSGQLIVGILLLQNNFLMMGVAVWFAAWIQVLYGYKNVPADQLQKINRRIILVVCTAPMFPYLITGILIPISKEGVYYSLMIYTSVCACISFSMMLGSSILTVQVLSLAPSKSSVREIFRKQLLVASLLFGSLGIAVIGLALNLPWYVVYDIDKFPKELLLAVAIFSSLGYCFSVTFGYVPWFVTKPSRASKEGSNMSGKQFKQQP